MLIVWSGWWWLRKTWVTASGATPRAGQRIEDQRAPGDHPGVRHDERVAVADEHDAAADAIGGVARVEEVDGGHPGMLPGRRVAAGRRDGRDGGDRAGPALSSSAACPRDRPADLVLRGGRIATMDAAGTVAAALAVRDGRIVAVGSDASVGALDRTAHAGSSSSAAGP